MSFNYEEIIEHITNQDFLSGNRELSENCEKVAKNYKNGELRDCCESGRNVVERIIRYLYRRLIPHGKLRCENQLGKILSDSSFKVALDNAKIVQLATSVNDISKKYKHAEMHDNETEEEFERRKKYENEQEIPVAVERMLEDLTEFLQLSIKHINENISSVRGRVILTLKGIDNADAELAKPYLESDLLDVEDRRGYDYQWEIKGAGRVAGGRIFNLTPYHIGKTIVFKATDKKTGQAVTAEYGPVKADEVARQGQKPAVNEMRSAMARPVLTSGEYETLPTSLEIEKEVVFHNESAFPRFCAKAPEGMECDAFWWITIDSAAPARASYSPIFGGPGRIYFEVRNNKFINSQYVCVACQNGKPVAKSPVSETVTEADYIVGGDKAVATKTTGADEPATADVETVSEKAAPTKAPAAKKLTSKPKPESVVPTEGLAGVLTFDGEAAYGKTLQAVVSESNAKGELHYIWTLDAEVLSTEAVFTCDEGSIGKRVECQVSTDKNRGVLKATTDVIAKATAAKPRKPSVKLIEVSSDSLVVTSTAKGVEFSIDGGESWVENGTFGNLRSDTEYTVSFRYKETSTHKASAINSVQWKTEPVQVAPVKPAVQKKVRAAHKKPDLPIPPTEQQITTAPHREEGSFTLPSGAKYKGQHINGVPDGHGTWASASGNTYTGEFLDGKFHGHGVLKELGRGVYEGEFEDGEKSGHGVYKHTERYHERIFEGDYLHGLRHGPGVIRFPDGRVLEQQYVRGSCRGDGVETYPDGTKYIGAFTNDRKSGKMRCIKPDGTEIICEFDSKGNLVKSDAPSDTVIKTASQSKPAETEKMQQNTAKSTAPENWRPMIAYKYWDKKSHTWGGPLLALRAADALSNIVVPIWVWVEPDQRVKRLMTVDEIKDAKCDEAFPWKKFLEVILTAEEREELEVRIGNRVSQGVSASKLKEFDAITNPVDAYVWLSANKPDFKKIVSEEQDRIFREVLVAAPEWRLNTIMIHLKKLRKGEE